MKTLKQKFARISCILLVIAFIIGMTPTIALARPTQVIIMVEVAVEIYNRDHPCVPPILWSVRNAEIVVYRHGVPVDTLVTDSHGAHFQSNIADRYAYSVRLARADEFNFITEVIPVNFEYRITTYLSYVRFYVVPIDPDNNRFTESLREYQQFINRQFVMGPPSMRMIPGIDRWTFLPPEQPPAATDIEAPSTWTRDYVTRATELGLVPQALQANFTQAITRAEFTALAVALYENRRGAITGRVTFDDTDDVNVQKAAYLGVVLGVGEGRFDPDAQLTREQAAVMLSRLADVMESPLPREAAAFADNYAVSDWALEGVGRVQAAGIMGGVGENRFAPQGAYTREQSIVTILRLFDILD